MMKFISLLRNQEIRLPAGVVRSYQNRDIWNHNQIQSFTKVIIKDLMICKSSYQTDYHHLQKTRYTHISIEGNSCYSIADGSKCLYKHKSFKRPKDFDLLDNEDIL